MYVNNVNMYIILNFLVILYRMRDSGLHSESFSVCNGLLSN